MLREELTRTGKELVAAKRATAAAEAAAKTQVAVAAAKAKAAAAELAALEEAAKAAEAKAAAAPPPSFLSDPLGQLLLASNVLLALTLLAVLRSGGGSGAARGGRGKVKHGME